MRNTALVVVSVLLFAVSSGAVAAQGERSFGEIYTDCGLGALIAQGIEDKNTADLVAIVTNVTWDLGTTAISSNLTSPESCARGDAKTAAFILQTYPQLEKELALGHGKYLDALITLTGVAEQQAFVSRVRGDFAAKVSEAGFQESARVDKARLLYQIVMSHS